MHGYRWLNEPSLAFLGKDYLAGLSVPERCQSIFAAAERRLGLPGFADRFHDYFRRGWYSLSSPIWANMGTDRGLPISCFGSHLEDTMESILATHAEVGSMSKYGGGTSGYFGELRGRGSPIRGNGESSGSVHFMQLFDTLINVVSQGSTRRGQFAAYLPIDHPDVEEFLGIRTEGHPVQDLSFGVCVPDAFMEAMIAGDGRARHLWARVLQRRSEVGYPYIFFADNANRGAADVYRDRGMPIRHSNLCTEIMLPDGPDESFVCDLSSMNVRYFDEWKGTDAVELMTFFLDAVMSEFIAKARDVPGFARSVRFAERHRALGIGWLGYHSYLQHKMVPFESMEAKRLNATIARTIYQQAHAASAKLAAAYGEPELLRGYGRRNTTLVAIAPTKSSAFILGQVSEGIEPFLANVQVEDLQKIKHTLWNPDLMDLLARRGMDTQAVRDSILEKAGSVQHLPLSDHEKAVFRTCGEIPPKEIVLQAAQRQRWVDQGQSLNLRIHPSVPPRDVNALLIEAWRLGLKSLYYQKGVNAAQEFSRNILACSSCEG